MKLLDLDAWIQVLWERANRSTNHFRKRLAGKGYLILDVQP